MTYTAPSKPLDLDVTNVRFQTAHVSWNPPADDGGSPITNYILRRYHGLGDTGDHVDSPGNSTHRDVTGLTPGEFYTFTVVAFNGKVKTPSDPSDPYAIFTMGGVWIRIGPTWMRAIPYVRHDGKWYPAEPFVRYLGDWKATA